MASPAKKTSDNRTGGSLSASAIESSTQISDDVNGTSMIQRPNGPELTGADPHAGKYTAREVATGGAASGAAWS